MFLFIEYRKLLPTLKRVLKEKASSQFDFRSTSELTLIIHPDDFFLLSTKVKREPSERYKLLVEVQLKSNSISQNPVVNTLINWKSNPEKLADVLNKFSFVEMKDILNCFVPIVVGLLQILEQDAKLQMYAYNTLIAVICLLVDDKTERYIFQVDRLESQIRQQFQNSSVYQIILNSLLYYLSKLDSKSHAKYIRSSIRTLPFLLKVMQLTHRQSDTKFLEDLKRVFTGLTELMKFDDPLLVGQQTAGLQSMGALIPSMSKLYDDQTVTDIVCTFMSSAINTMSATPSLNVEKLLFVQSVVNSDFYLHDRECATKLITLVVFVLEKHLRGSRKEIIECSYCLSVLLVSENQTRFSKLPTMDFLRPESVLTCQALFIGCSAK
jgi:hypothetical protein